MLDAKRSRTTGIPELARFKIRALSAIQLIDYFEQFGTPADELLQSSGVDKHALSNPHDWIPLESFYTILDNCNAIAPPLTLEDWQNIGAQIQKGRTSNLFRSLVSLVGVRTMVALSPKYVRKMNNFSRFTVIRLNRNSAELVISLDDVVPRFSAGAYLRWVAGVLSAFPQVYGGQRAAVSILYDQASLKNIIERLYRRYHLRYSEKEDVIYVDGKAIAKNIRLEKININHQTVFSDVFNDSKPPNATVITENFQIDGLTLLKKGDIFNAPCGRLRMTWRDSSWLPRVATWLWGLLPLSKRNRSLLEKQIELADRRFFESERLRIREQKALAQLKQTNLELELKIEDLKKAREALKESEQNYEALFNASLDCIYLHDLAGNFIQANHAALDLLGYARGDLPTVTIASLIEKSDLKKTAETFRNLMKNGFQHDLTEYRLKKKDGEYVDVETKGSVIHRDGVPWAIMGIARDVTKKKQAEKQLFHSEKMAALGDLVAGVAHEISTPLGVGVMSASFLEELSRQHHSQVENGRITVSETKKFSQKANEAAALILTNLRRAADLLNSFKQVAVDQSADDRRTFNLKDYIEEVLESLQPKYKRTGHTVGVSGPDDLLINSFPGAFSQIVTNLAMNSLIHAFERMEQGRIEFRIALQRKSVFIVCEDNGCGMDEHTRKKHFDPFFTTKRGQGGSGLGMHIVYNLITQKLNGQIDCWSMPGKGTRYTITIPK